MQPQALAGGVRPPADPRTARGCVASRVGYTVDGGAEGHARAGLLGSVTKDNESYLAEWTDTHGKRHRQWFDRETSAVRHVVREQFGGLSFHDLRHSYATWLVDEGVPPNMVLRVIGHERRWISIPAAPRTRHGSCGALGDDPEGGAAGARARVMPI